jgi:uncharacterized MAPEG superfamily protein
MTIAEWCLFGAVLLYLLTVAPVKALGHREFNNADPRNPDFYEHPMRKRALGAHLNGVETFPFFAAAVLLAEFKDAPQNMVDALALGFLLTRMAFVLAYLADRPTLRTFLWNAAFAFNLGLLFLPGFGVRGAIVAVVLGLALAVTTASIAAAVGRRNQGRSADAPPRASGVQ